MPISENVAVFMRRYKEEHHLSIAELSDELGIAKNSTVDYLKGVGNPGANMVDLMAEKFGVSVAEIVSAQPQEWERAEIMERAARLFSDMPQEQRDRAVKLFLALIDVIAEGDSV